MATPLRVTAALPHLNNILIPTDLSDDAVQVLSYAGQIARAFGAKIYLCHIHADVPLAAGLASLRLYEAEGKGAVEHLASFRRSPELQGVEPKLILASGKLQDEIPKLIAANGIDMIMAGTHGRTGLAKMMLGSVAEEICRVATCPVFTTGPAVEPVLDASFKNILFATNLSQVSKKTLPYISLLGEKYGSHVTVLHVANQVGPVERENNADFIRGVMAREFGAALAPFQPKFAVAAGSTAETVLRVAKEMKAGLIALGIRNAFRPGILVERTAYRIMAGAHCPVLSVP